MLSSGAVCIVITALDNFKMSAPMDVNSEMLDDDAEILRLQSALSMHGALIQDVQHKMTQLWLENKENLGYKIRIRKLECDVDAIRQRNRFLKMKLSSEKQCNCAEVRRERDFYFRKYTICEQKLTELQAEKDKLLAEARAEIARLKSLVQGHEGELSQFQAQGGSERPADAVETSSQVEICGEVGGDLIVKMEPADHLPDDGPDLYTRISENINHLQTEHHPICDVVPVLGCDVAFHREEGSRRHNCPFDNCAKSFAYDYSLRAHMRSHNVQTRFKCTAEGCGKIFLEKRKLDRHVLRHSAAMPYKCTISGCNRRFSGTRGLRRHVSEHNGEKPFQCSFPGCLRRFVRREHLKSHENAHVGYKPYRCTVTGCGHCFTRRWGLTQHMLSRHSEET